MTTIQFYHLTTTPLERALPKLLEKAYANGLRTLLVAESEERVEQLNQLLWTYDPNGFLPHGSAKDGNEAEQPIFIGTTPVSPNNAMVLAVTDGSLIDNSTVYDRVLDIFDGNKPDTVESARNRWKKYKELSFSLTYFRQTDSGGWEQKAVA